MLLRPATPLSVLLSIAFALLLLSTLSTPIIKAIPLSVDQGWEFGVFGYCDTSGNNCISPHIGYSTETLFAGGSNGGDFSLPVTSRKTLSYILIVHPIAALMTLVCDILAIASHFHGPSSSAKFLLALLILTIPTLLLSLLAFLVDILLFVPHMAWGGWIVLAATILIVGSSVLICAMRRTLISRKARTKRIAENSEMNGETYFNTLNNHRAMAATMPRADSPPPISAYDSSKAGTGLASFDVSTGRTSEDRAPLNPTMRSASTGPGARRPYGSEDDLPPMPVNGQPVYDEHGRVMGPGPRRDEYGSPVSPIGPEGMAMPVLTHSNSRGSLNSNGSGRGGPGYGRGRGYGPRGGYGPPRGGYGPPGRGYGPPRGGYGPRGGYRGGAPPQGWNGRGGYGPQGGMGPRAQSPNAYGNDPYYSNDRSMDSRMQDDFVARGPSPHVPIGQAIEMDERTGSPPALSYGQYGQAPVDPERSNSRSPAADAAYVPARAGWKPVQPPNEPMRFSPDNTSSHYSSGRNVQLSPIQASPTSSHDVMSGAAQHTRAGSENYYEDVDPRFTNDRSSPQQALPNALMPGSAYSGPARMQSPISPPQAHDPDLLQPPPLHPRKPNTRLLPTDHDNSNPSLDDISEGERPAASVSSQPDGTRSPNGSEASHFTSISQRPVNPDWRPGYAGGPGDGSSAVAARQRKEDILLNGNPDFSIPGVAPGRGRGRHRGGRGSGSGSMGGGSLGLTPPGRYPTEF